MSWNAILMLLMNLLAQELPGVLSALAEWLKRRLAPPEVTAATMATTSDDIIPTAGSLEEFKAAVKARLQRMIDGMRPGFIKMALRTVTNHLTDGILDRLYRMVTDTSAAPEMFATCPNSTLDADCCVLDAMEAMHDMAA